MLDIALAFPIAFFMARAGTATLADVPHHDRRPGLATPVAPGTSIPPPAIALALWCGLALAVAGCDVGRVPATPPITPGVAGAPREVNVILKDYLFVPSIVDVVPGETIHLNVINGGLDTHELVIGPQAVQDAWAAAERPAADPPPGPTPIVTVAPSLVGIRIVAGSGETRSITWTVPSGVGGFLIGCHISDHFERGMAGVIHPVGPGGAPLAPSSSPVR